MDRGVHETNREAISNEMKLHISHSMQITFLMTQFEMELRKKEKLLEEQRRKLVTLEANIERFGLSAEKHPDFSDNSRPATGCDSADEVEQYVVCYILRTTRCKLLQGQMQSKVSNGAFLWDVTTLEEHRFNTIEGRIQRLYNSPTYTSRFGYRLCLWLYLGGDSSGEGAPISVFLLIKHPDKDIFYPWPLSLPVAITMMNQDPSKSVSRSMYADPDLSNHAEFAPEQTMFSVFRTNMDGAVLLGLSYISVSML